jgi:uncharacterized protein (DUF1499 family)
MRRWLKRIFWIIATPVALLAALMGVEASFGQPLGAFAGRTPTDLGVNSGKFKPCDWKPNCVSSHADTTDAVHFFTPMPYDLPDAEAERLAGAMLKQLPNTRVVAEGGGYFRAEAKSPKLGFVDDVEVFLDPRSKAVYVRSASRLGIRDFGANRNRMDALKTSLASNLMQPRQRVLIDMDKPAGTAPSVTMPPASGAPNASPVKPGEPAK